MWLFPEHSAFLVDLCIFLLLLGIAYKSADLAIRVQYLIMAIIAGSLVSIAVAAFDGSMQHDLTDVGLWGSYRGAPETGFSGTNFWVVFAVFFPAATGIMAGANMSGELTDPRRSIPVGTMSAIGVSLVIYLLLGYWIVRSASPDELVENYYVIIEKAKWGSLVVAGALGAAFSSALSSMVGAARILQAMGAHRVVPGSHWIGSLTRRGEPRNSMLITGGIVFASLLLRDLNLIAPVITMFFLITYAMLNVVVLVEQSLGLVSFRPLLKVPRLVSVLGLAGSVFAMFIINPAISLVSVAVVVVFYGVLARRKMDAPFEDVRSGLFVALSEWAAKRASDLPSMQERAWKPNLLAPVTDVRMLRGALFMIESIAYPRGSVKLLGLGPSVVQAQLDLVTREFRDRGVFASSMVVDDASFVHGVISGMQVLQGAFFRPNILFLDMPVTEEDEEGRQRVIHQASALGMGSLVFAPHPQAGLGQRNHVNVWIRDRTPDWRLSWDVGNLDLSILSAYKLICNWRADMRILTVVRDKADEESAKEFMSRLVDLARIPATQVVVAHGDFNNFVLRAPQADLNIFGLAPDTNFGFIRRMVRTTKSTCLFVQDSGRENVLA